MDPILQVLLSWQFIFFGLAIAAVMYVLRIVVEYIATLLKKNLLQSTLWNNLILPVLPVVLGSLTAFFLKIFPYPGFTVGSRGYVVTGDRIIFGLVAGLLSTLMYRVIKSLLYQKMVGIAQSLNGTTITPPAPPIVAEPIASNEISSRGQL